MELLDSNQCTGCSACFSICPKGAISMEDTIKGFFVPQISSEICIECGLCRRTCPEINSQNTVFYSPKEVYLGKNVDEIRIASSSGGMFYSLAKEIIDRDGTVYGAKFNSNLMVEHGRAHNDEGIKEFCGSKYIQSSVGNVYALVYNDLKENKWVYFSGTACQVAGLISYLNLKKCNIDKLITQDFICHGVGSPSFFTYYKQLLEKKFKSKIVKFNFRGKPSSYKLQNSVIDFQNGKKYIVASTSQDLFYFHYFKNLIVKSSCFSCKYANVNRVADITLGDCYHPSEEQIINDGFGISYLQINTAKGLELWESLNTSKMEKTEVDYKKYVQPNMQKPSIKNENYDNFWKEYENNGFKTATKLYGNGTVIGEVKRMAAQLIYKIKH